MSSFIFAGFAIISLAFAARIVNPGGETNLVDVTQELLKIESSGNTAVRCCCDATAPKLANLFAANVDRSGRCQIFTSENVFKCGKVARPKWLKHNNGLNHFSKCKDPRCLVPEDEVEQFYRTHGTADNYCSSFKIDKTLVGAVALGKDSSVTCDAGYKPQVEHVTCMWESIQKGIFDPRPECVRDEEWCAAVDMPQVLSVAATELGVSSLVTCMPGFEPVHKESTCTTDRSFKPTPECKPISNYCQLNAYSPEAPSVQPAAKNEWVPVKCALGLAPSSESTQCTEGGTFQPQPYCMKVWDFCPSLTTKPEPRQLISPGPSVNQAALGYREMVWCRIGWEPQPQEVHCTESGNFHPEPKCLKDWTWCPSYDEGDTWVRSTGRDDVEQVHCSHKDYKPAAEYVRCGKNHEFEPTPACVLK